MSGHAMPGASAAITLRCASSTTALPHCWQRERLLPKTNLRQPASYPSAEDVPGHQAKGCCTGTTQQSFHKNNAPLVINASAAGRQLPAHPESSGRCFAQALKQQKKRLINDHTTITSSTKTHLQQAASCQPTQENYAGALHRQS
jgi:hypothetical protein